MFSLALLILFAVLSHCTWDIGTKPHQKDRFTQTIGHMYVK